MSSEEQFNVAEVSGCQVREESNVGEELTQCEEQEVIEYGDFEEMGLSDDLLKGIFAYGFEKPSRIQMKAIVPLIKGLDLIAQAQSGTGKTGTFCIGALSKVRLEQKKPQILVIEPTRELASQVALVMESLSEFMEIGVHLSIGGVRPQEEQRQFRKLLEGKGAQVVVGTPGRIYDVLSRGRIPVDQIQLMILDEADEMLSQGFMEDVRRIFNCLGSEVQVGLFSATMPPGAMEITERFMRNPVKIVVNREELTLDGILQFYVDVERDQFKFEVICDLYQAFNVSQSVIFCRSRKRVDQLVTRMEQDGFTCSAIHGEMSHQDRQEVMRKFRLGEVRFLVATDLVARGIDVQGVSVVINYDLPNERANYIHRIGRAGRFGRKGVAINLVTGRDLADLQHLREYYHTQIESLPANMAGLV